MKRRKAPPHPKPNKLKRTLADIHMQSDTRRLVGELESFLTSGTWKVIQGILAEEAFTHEAAMRTFLRKSNLAVEASYECGATEALEHFSNHMIQQFIETLKTGKPAGVVEQNKPEEGLEEIASGSVTTREEN